MSPWSTGLICYCYVNILVKRQIDNCFINESSSTSEAELYAINELFQISKSVDVL